MSEQNLDDFFMEMQNIRYAIPIDNSYTGRLETLYI